jgi:serine/threonine protein kinase
VKVMDLGETEQGDPFIVMELLHGKSVAALLAERRVFGQGLTVEIATAVCRALVAAHAAGVVHRDLKPENVFLQQDPDLGTEVKVLDFGVSKVMSDDTHATQSGVLVGTVAYMSPEQALTPKEIDARTDLWSLGLLMFEMLTGRNPFDDDAHYKILARIVQDTPFGRDAEHLDPELVRVVMGCLERSLDRRFGSAAELLAELEKLGQRTFTDPEVVRATGMSSTLKESEGARRPQGANGRSRAHFLLGHCAIANRSRRGRQARALGGRRCRRGRDSDSRVRGDTREGARRRTGTCSRPPASTAPSAMPPAPSAASSAPPTVTPALSASAAPSAAASSTPPVVAKPRRSAPKKPPPVPGIPDKPW